MTGAPGHATGLDRAERDTARDAEPDHDLVALSRRFAGLAKQLEQLVEKSASDPDPDPDIDQADGSERLIDAIERMDRRLDHLVEENRAASGQIERRVGAVDRALASLGRVRVMGTITGHVVDIGVDRAVAEIAARQRMLAGEPPMLADEPAMFDTMPQAAPEAAPDGPDWSGLEAQLRDITRMLQAMQSPCRAEDLVAGLRQELADIARTVQEAIPRHAFEALESEVRVLGARLDVSRHPGADVASLAPLEKGLAEVRDALIGLAPVGLDDAVKTLSQKVDVIAAQGGDPAALQQLESAIAGLRGIVAHVASGEALSALAKEVRELGDKIDVSASADRNDAIANLEKEIAGIAETLKGQQVQSGASDIAPLFAELSEKLDRLQLSGSERSLLGALEERIARLVEKLDASEARLGSLASIERGMAELLVHLEDRRARRGSDAAGPGGAAVDMLGDVAHPAEIDTEGERRIRESLDIAGTAGPAVERRATIAPERPDERRQPARRAPVAPPQAPAASPEAPSAAEARLAPDTPLEPGSGSPRGRTRSVAERIAASQAALGSAKPAGEGEAKPNFIVAARRAAQAASEQQAPYQRAGGPASEAAPGTLGKKLAERVKSLFVTTNVILIAIVAVPVAAKYAGLLELGASPPVEQAAIVAPPAPVGAPPAPAQASAAPATTDSAARGLAQQNSGLVLGNDPALAFANSGLIGRPLESDITGALSPARDQRPAPTSTPVRPAPGSAPAAWTEIPAGIGGKALLAGIAAGDPAAAYEVATRLVEGRGVAANLETAAMWFGRAAERGLPLAQFRLGNMYEKGLGLKKDLSSAHRLYVAAAEKGNANAMHNIAVLHAEGIDGKPDYAVASQWFLKAARYGVKDSQYNLAILYARGIGVEQSLQEAYKWFALAAERGDQDAAKKRDDIGAKLDPAALAAARQAAQSWVAEPQPQEATSVAAPPGGWDDAAASPAASGAPAKPKARPRMEQAARL